ncbi:MAG: response regulator transcription factor [Chloroflexi bacterium]|nr:response regulator transcription factor [Chloroflexota bacterium]MYC47065.1 response regulator transcription factor [Chloroflexota bacterium]
MTSAMPLERSDPCAEHAPEPGDISLRAVLVIAPDAYVADAILHSLKRRRACRFLAWVKDADAAVRRLAAERFDLVVLAGLAPEFALPAVKRLRACLGSTRILVALHQIPAPVIVDDFVKAGSSGLVDCATGYSDLPAAGQIVAHGHSILPRRADLKLSNEIPEMVVGPEELSERERQILELVAVGLTSRQAAEKLYLSVHTVEKYLSVCYRKLQAANRVQACNIARYYGLI